MSAKSKRSRESERLPVSPREIQGTVVNDDGEADQVALVWNVSVQGLCLWVSQKYKANAKVTLRVSKPWKGEVSCTVRWCRAVPDRSGYLIGLETTTGDAKLTAFHASITKASKKAG